MLVLSRKVGEVIVLPELGIRITMLRTTPHTARIGIEAPKRYTIIREELQQLGNPQPVQADASASQELPADTSIVN